MKLGRILRAGPDGPEPRLVTVFPTEGTVVDLAGAERIRLEEAGATAEAARRLAGSLFPGSMAAALAAGPAFADGVERALAHGRAGAELPIGEVGWTSPIDPPVMIDASAFEEHLVNAHARAKRQVPDYFYEAPAYYKMNTLTVIGPDAEVRWPADVGYMDYELEVGFVIGATGSDLRPEETAAYLFGVTVMDDFSARDVQGREMTSGFGPAKGKDFATALGPWITTVDELDLDDLAMVARINGEEWSRGSTSTLTWSVDEILAFASRGETLVPGEVIGSGTVGLGSGLELYRKLQPGDVVELEVDGIGVLRNRIGRPDESRWRPEPKERRSPVTSPKREDAPRGAG